MLVAALALADALVEDLVAALVGWWRLFLVVSRMLTALAVEVR